MPRLISILGLPRWFSGKESACSVGNMGSILGSGRFPGEENSDPLQCSCLGNHTEDPSRLQYMGSQKSQTQLSN